MSEELSQASASIPNGGGLRIDEQRGIATFEIKPPDYAQPGGEFQVRVLDYVIQCECPTTYTHGQVFQCKLPLILKRASSRKKPGVRDIVVPDGIGVGDFFPVNLPGLEPFMVRCENGNDWPGFSIPVIPPSHFFENEVVIKNVTLISARRSSFHEICTWNRARDDVRRSRRGQRLRPIPSDSVGERIHKLPALASSFHGVDIYEWNDTTRVILAGVHDKSSPLSAFLGKEETVLDLIFSFLASKWASKVTLTLPAYAIGEPHFSFEEEELMKFCEANDNGSPSVRIMPREELTKDVSGRPLQGLVSNIPIKIIENFPEPAEINVNMLPFVFGDRCSLPEELRSYHNLIEQCPYNEEEVGKVGYLTVHESYVNATGTQRRGGLHIETPGEFSDEDPAVFVPGSEHRWGMGVFFGNDRLEGGIFMASTVADTSVVWDALVDKNAKGIVDCHGGCEHLRPLLGPGRKLEANELIWMTDCTPHEALPQKESGYRQFFRVVTSNISHWFADHSTPNPLVSLPEDVIVVHGSKFETRKNEM